MRKKCIQALYKYIFIYIYCIYSLYDGRAFYTHVARLWCLVYVHSGQRPLSMLFLCQYIIYMYIKMMRAIGFPLYNTSTHTLYLSLILLHVKVACIGYTPPPRSSGPCCPSRFKKKRRGYYIKMEHSLYTAYNTSCCLYNKPIIYYTYNRRHFLFGFLIAMASHVFKQT